MAVEKLPTQIPNTGTVNLTPLRGLLGIHGPGAEKFLNGLITKIFPSESESGGVFTSFLSPQVATIPICS
jgi:folate-binding Fe-S cluster repair protein YgfZ